LLGFDAVCMAPRCDNARARCGFAAQGRIAIPDQLGKSERRKYIRQVQTWVQCLEQRIR
jgi:hypothetical protein